MPICYRPDCTSGAEGKRFSGAADEVHAHEVEVHGKPLSGRVKGQDIKLIKSVLWVGVYEYKGARAK